MSAWYDIVRDGPWWRVCRCTNPLDAPGRLATVAVERYTHRDAAIIRARALNAASDGLRRLGVAVAVWGAMAAAAKERNAWLEIVAHYECARAQRLHALATALRDELAAERAARRKWELRLRWRSQYPSHEVAFDRLTERSLIGGGQKRLRSWPIAGPRGVLP